MSTRRPQGEKRKTFRCGVPEGRRKAVLAVGRRRIRVELVNESSDGFAAWCERDPRLKRGDEAYLHTAVGKYEVCVAHVTRRAEDSSEAAAGNESPSATGSRFHIGLRVVRELDVQFEPSGQTRGWLGLRLLVSSEFVFGAIVALLITAVVVAATVAAASWKDGRWVDDLLSFGQSTANELSPNEVRLQAVVRALGLSDVQRQQLSTVAENVATAMTYLDDQWQDDPPEERARKQQLLAEATCREIMGFLSAEQQQRWHAAFGTPGN